MGISKRVAFSCRCRCYDSVGQKRLARTYVHGCKSLHEKQIVIGGQTNEFPRKDLTGKVVHELHQQFRPVDVVVRLS